MIYVMDVSSNGSMVPTLLIIPSQIFNWYFLDGCDIHLAVATFAPKGFHEWFVVFETVGALLFVSSW